MFGSDVASGVAVRDAVDVGGAAHRELVLTASPSTARSRCCGAVAGVRQDAGTGPHGAAASAALSGLVDGSRHRPPSAAPHTPLSAGRLRGRRLCRRRRVRRLRALLGRRRRLLGEGDARHARLRRDWRAFASRSRCCCEGL